MPIYEYGCAVCGHQFEVLVRSKSDLPKKCSVCGARKPAKRMSAFAVAVNSSSPCSACPAGGDAGMCGSNSGGGCGAGGCHF